MEQFNEWLDMFEELDTKEGLNNLEKELIKNKFNNIFNKFSKYKNLNYRDEWFTWEVHFREWKNKFWKYKDIILFSWEIPGFKSIRLFNWKLSEYGWWPIDCDNRMNSIDSVINWQEKNHSSITNINHIKNNLTKMEKKLDQLNLNLSTQELRDLADQYWI